MHIYNVSFKLWADSDECNDVKYNGFHFIHLNTLYNIKIKIKHQ